MSLLLLSPGSSSPLSAGSDSDYENSADDDPADSGDEEPVDNSDEDTAEPTPPVGMCLGLSYVEGEWHDVFVHSYDEDGSAWFIDAELGPDGNINKDEDLIYFLRISPTTKWSSAARQTARKIINQL